jgi:hypothetical protein
VDTSSKNYIVDFRPIFSILSQKDVDEFYFYPGEIFGFVESCILATQRDIDEETRHRYIVNDLLGAMEVWTQKEENHMARTSGSWVNGRSLDRSLVLKLAAQAIAIDTFVYRTMSNLYEAHGHLAINAHSMNWTPANALRLEVSY